MDSGANASPGGFLIVDDVEINNFVAKETLMPYGKPVDVAGSGIEAVRRIESGNVYDVIFMDHMMPDMDGIKATSIIRGMGYTGCIIALTARPPGEDDRQYLDSGFDGTLIKPLNPTELDEIIRKFAQSAAQPKTEGGGDKLTDMREYFIMDAESAISELEGLLQSMHSLSDDEFELYEITVHGMKSALRNIGRTELGEVAYKLEMAAKDRDTAIMAEDTPALIKRLKELIVELRAGMP